MAQQKSGIGANAPCPLSRPHPTGSATPLAPAMAHQIVDEPLDEFRRHGVVEPRMATIDGVREDAVQAWIGDPLIPDVERKVAAKAMVGIGWKT